MIISTLSALAVLFGWASLAETRRALRDDDLVLPGIIVMVLSLVAAFLAGAAT